MIKKMSKEEIEYREKLKLLEKHIGEDYYMIGSIHGKISDAMEEYHQSKLNNNGDLGSIIIPNNKSEKNIILSRAMTYLSEDAEECGMAKQIFDELASLMDK